MKGEIPLRGMTTFLSNRDIYTSVVCGIVPQAKERLWIATADIKDMYFGSANLTGAGMGSKCEKKRNFENGVLTDDPALVEPLVEQFDSVWRGDFCRDCGRREHCTDPVV